MPATRLLAIGDIHLGRQSSRLPPDLDPAELGPAAALRLAARTAVAEKVQAVLLAGDLVDGDGDLYHALGVLTEILTALREEGIEVLAVAGNHDHAVLPRLARAVPGLRVLGEGGRWQHVTLAGPGGPVRILGWSFPGAHHPDSPAADLPRLPDGPPVIGLLHADLEAPGSRYAPVRRAELAAAGPCRWLLGHVHAPSLDPAGREPGYLGSLAGLDPTETGPRGPWLVEVEGGEATLRHLPLAPLRWQALELPIGDRPVAHLELEAAVLEVLRDFARQHAEQLRSAAVLGVRLGLTGRVAHFSALAASIAGLAGDRIVMEIAPGLQAFVDRIDNRCLPAHDLAAMATRDDPPGLLAHELLALREGRADALLTQARQTVRRIDGQNSFQSLVLDPVAAGEADDDTLTAMLLQTGYRILDDLLRAREAADGSA